MQVDDGLRLWSPSQHFACFGHASPVFLGMGQIRSCHKLMLVQVSYDLIGVYCDQASHFSLSRQLSYSGILIDT